MEDLKSIFTECSSDISLMQKKLCDKNIQVKAMQLLQSLQLDKLVKPRILLSGFLLYHFPREMFSVGEDVSLLRDTLNNMMKETDEKVIRKYICEYSIAFKKWSADDLDNLKNQLLHEYHELQVESMNVENDDVKYIYGETQRAILKCAKTIGFDQQILNYCPVVIDKDEYNKEYTMVLYDELQEELKNKKLHHTKQLLLYIQKFIKLLLPNEQDFDIDLLEQIICNEACNEEEVRAFFSELYDSMKKIQSVQKDEQLEEFRSYLRSDKNVNIAKHLIFLLDLVQGTVEDFEKLTT
jgi:hypothetical protein